MNKQTSENLRIKNKNVCTFESNDETAQKCDGDSEEKGL